MYVQLTVIYKFNFTTQQINIVHIFFAIQVFLLIIYIYLYLCVVIFQHSARHFNILQQKQVTFTYTPAIWTVTGPLS